MMPNWTLGDQPTHSAVAAPGVHCGQNTGCRGHQIQPRTKISNGMTIAFSEGGATAFCEMFSQHRMPNSAQQQSAGAQQMLSTVLLILLILMLLGALPAWPHSRNWGYAPTGGLSLIVVILLVLILMGRL